MAQDINPLSTTVYLGAFTGSTGTEVPIFVSPVACRITGIYVMDKTGIASHATAFGIITIKRKGATGSGTTTVATYSTGAAKAITAYVPKAVTLSTTKSYLELTAGEALTAAFTEAGAGKDWGGAAVTICYAPGYGGAL